MTAGKLQGKTALVTGAGRGIGRSIAFALAREEVRTIVTARTTTEIEAVAAEIRDAGYEADALRADLSDPHDVSALFAKTGPIDILVNNAGIIGPIAPLAEANFDAWQQNIAINLTACAAAMQAALHGMLEQGWGRIVNISSGAARGTTVGWSAYSASKAGVEALTSVVAREVADRDVRIVGLRPGIVDTEMQVEIRSSTEEQFSRENVERFRRYKETGMLRSPDDPARVVLWLLSDEAAAYHGQTVAIDDPEIAAKVGLQPIGR